MVFKGQDAWRKHPLLSGNWKRPFPHVRLAAQLFAVFLVCDTAFSFALVPPPSADHGVTHRYKDVFKQGEPAVKYVGKKGDHH